MSVTERRLSMACAGHAHDTPDYNNQRDLRENCDEEQHVGPEFVPLASRPEFGKSARICSSLRSRRSRCRPTR